LLLFAGLALAVISACHNAQLAEYRAYASDADVPRISVQEAKMDYDSGTAIIIDSRDANSYGQEHIAGSINIPSGSADADYTDIPKDKKIIVYCS
jgi:rhodanese-related sulfurtransferase